MEKKMETTMILAFKGIRVGMEKKMETTIILGYMGFGV